MSLNSKNVAAAVLVLTVTLSLNACSTDHPTTTKRDTAIGATSVVNGSTYDSEVGEGTGEGDSHGNRGGMNGHHASKR